MNLHKDIIDDFLHAGQIYLNNASTSLMPSQSITAMNEFLIEYNSLGPDSTKSNAYVVEKLQSVRKLIAKIIACQPDEVVLTQSTTDGVNIVANGIILDSNSNIIIRGMTHEHHSNLYPWLNLSKRSLIKSLPIDKDGFFNIDDLKEQIDDNTKLVALSHALYNTGTVLPIEEIASVLQDTTPFFLDSAQTVGCMGMLDVSKLGCNFMSFNGSKWLCGPMGTGIFYCSRRSSDLLKPTTIGGESALLYDATNLAFKDLPDKFQTGFRNYVGMVGLESSINYLLKFGMDNIRQKNMRLANLLRDELIKIPNIVVYGPDDPKQRTSIVSFNVTGTDPRAIVDRLEEQGIILAVREIYDQKIVRVAPHFFNRESDMMRLVDAIRGL